MKTSDEFETILSDALAEYREAEPLAGLEDRVLRRVQERGRQRKLCWRWSFAAGLAMALLAAAAWIELRVPPHRPLFERTAVQQMPVPLGPARNLAALQKLKSGHPEQLLPEILGQSQPERASAKARPAPTAKLPAHKSFPASAPLTSEERALLALAHTNPDALRTLPRNDGELAIAPITIEPLTSTGGDNQGDN